MPTTTRSNEGEKKKSSVIEKADGEKRKVKSSRDRPRKSTSRSTHKKSLSSPDPKPSTQPSPVVRRKKRDSFSDNENETRKMSPSSSRTSLPYPSFSKAHSKESVIPVELKRVDALTPDPTDLGEGKDDSDSEERAKATEEKTKLRKGPTITGTRNAAGKNGVSGGAPPSPPLTTMSRPPRRSTPGSRTGSRASKLAKEGSSPVVEDKPEVKKATSGPHSWMSRLTSSSRKGGDGPSRTTSITSTRSATPSTRKSTVSTATIERTPSREPERDASSELSRETTSTLDSDATSLARNHPQPAKTANIASTSILSATEISQAPSDAESYTLPSTHPTPEPTKTAEVRFGPEVVDTPPNEIFSSPQPPPPPPPPAIPVSIPRVDYLLHNGGLPRNVPRTLLSATQPITTTYQSLAYPQHSFPRASSQTIAEIEKIFAPYHGLLDEYQAVLSKNGSIAVATGYRSVARKLLDRLENVFARDISCETCECVICCKDSGIHQDDDDAGLGWGEVLEWVSGRRETPVWPAFDFGSLDDPAKLSQDIMGLGISTSGSPVKPAPIDSDVPEEFRDHYVRQSKKTKQTVDRWLTSQPANPSAPPPEVDDETLTFAILTYLDKPDRPVFTALLSSPAKANLPPDSRAPTPLRPRSELMTKTSLALQRLYRLSAPPRDPETAIYLLKHPSLHNLLATLAVINSAEWDVLTSGRFDGFLWSGADDPSSTSTTTPQVSRHPTPAIRPQSSASRTTTPFSTGGRGPSRTTTPFHHLASTAASRAATPAAPGPPVPHDEETEIAVLAEVEREIYVGMEALEDAFEALHRKAEVVRQALRERGAGLSMAGQARRQAMGLGGVEVVNGTPGPGPVFGNGGDWESESECGWGAAGGDTSSEVWPDDSASNVSSSRHRRPKRRNERRTPALVEEESEDD